MGSTPTKRTEGSNLQRGDETTPAKSLRLILGDQLNQAHPWFQSNDDTVIYLIAELKQEAVYVRHHIQKVCAFFAAMQAFANWLQEQGHRVVYLTLDESSQFADLPSLIKALLQNHACERFEYQRPDEYRLHEQLCGLCSELALASREVDTGHFLLPFDDIDQYFKPGKHVRMESFYRKMRVRHQVLVENDEPVGGRWNYDDQNRGAFKASDLQHIPAPLCFSNDISPILERLRRHGIHTIGRSDQHCLWPVNREQSLALLEFFCAQLLPRFGRFQDAMTCNSEHQWSLYHSRLSFALNAKILSPAEVIDTALAAYYEAKGGIELAQIEGFVRQIIGWREYVRGMYWTNMPDYQHRNELQASTPLPDWFWTGETRMQCLSSAITQSLDYAYAHHIQRLMITGNFALLAGIDPDQVDAWYLGIYIDAIEWVELPNTRSMALFADGGWIATKPYAASGNYVNKMSDYCKQCAYKVTLKTEENACPLNSLYWHFIDRHAGMLKQNPRMRFPLKNWEKQGPDQKSALLAKARHLLENIQSL